MSTKLGRRKLRQKQINAKSR